MSEKEQELSKGQKAYLKRIVNQFNEDATKELNAIRQLKTQLIQGEEGGISLLEKFQKTENELEEISNIVKSFHKDIFISKVEGQQSFSESIIDFKENFSKTKSEIDIIKDSIEDYSEELFGKENEEGEPIPGIQDKINSQISRLNQLHKDNKEKQESLFDEIEQLLKGASTVALAKSFKDHKDSFNIANYIWMGLFVLSIMSMMIVSIYIFDKANFEIKDMWRGTIGNLPFIGGAIWIAIYSSKQRSQNKRLQQEYAYKEDVAKIYYGLKKEIEELDDSDLGRQLNKKILDIIVDVVSLNPSETLESNSHNDKGPVLEALNNLTSIVKNNG